MTISNDIKKKLAESPEFRAEFVASLVKHAFPLQVRTIRKKRGMTQEQLAEAAKIDQGVVSRAENINNGNLTFNTALNVSSGFGLTFIPKLAAFSEFLKWVDEIAAGFTDLPSFETELNEGTLGHNAKIAPNPPQAATTQRDNVVKISDYLSKGKPPQRETGPISGFEQSGLSEKLEEKIAKGRQ